MQEAHWEVEAVRIPQATELQAGEVLVECRPGSETRPPNVVDMRVFLEALVESVVVIDSSGLMVFVNARTEALFGYAREEMLGCSLGMLLPERFRERHALHVADIFQKPQNRPMGAGLSLTGLRKDGAEFPTEVSLSYLALEGGPLVAAFVVDMTASKAAEAALQHLNETLKERNQDLEAYAQTVAHDLKGPLGVVLGYAELLLDERYDLTSGLAETCITQILQGGRRMVRIIQELLLLASVRRGEVTLEPLDMGRIVAEVQARLSKTQQEKQGELFVAAVWPVALGHASWVEEVWVNYVSNALKYGGQPPQVELGATPLPNGFIKFWVRDNGAGLTPEQQAALFKPFTRLDRVRVTGNGLGLSIVANIIHKMGGEIGGKARSARAAPSVLRCPRSRYNEMFSCASSRRCVR